MEKPVQDLSRAATGHTQSGFSFFNSAAHYVPIGAHFTARESSPWHGDGGSSYGDSMNASDLVDDFEIPPSEISRSCPHERDDEEGDWSLTFYSQERDVNEAVGAPWTEFEELRAQRPDPPRASRPSRHDPRLYSSPGARRRLLYAHEPPLTPPTHQAAERECTLHSLLAAVSDVVQADGTREMNVLVEKLRANFDDYVCERGWCRNHKIKECVLCALGNVE